MTTHSAWGARGALRNEPGGARLGSGIGVPSSGGRRGTSVRPSPLALRDYDVDDYQGEGPPTIAWTSSSRGGFVIAWGIAAVFMVLAIVWMVAR